jgi:hypothetical protein
LRDFEQYGHEIYSSPQAKLMRNPRRAGPTWGYACNTVLQAHIHVATAQELTVYFGTPNMFITLWFGFDYGTNPPLDTLII